MFVNSYRLLLGNGEALLLTYINKISFSVKISLKRGSSATQFFIQLIYRPIDTTIVSGGTAGICLSVAIYHRLIPVRVPLSVPWFGPIVIQLLFFRRQLI